MSYLIPVFILLIAAGCGGGGGGGGQGGNKPPVADAGPDKTVKVNHSVTVDGSGSYDPDGNIVSYEWKEGSTVLANTATFTYTPTSVGNHTLTLTVTDDDNATDSDSMVVTAVNNHPPVADAGPDKIVEVNTTVHIVGSCTDSDGSITSCVWTENGTQLATTAEFDYKPTTVGDHNLTLTATDDDGATGSDSMTVTAKESGSGTAGDLDGDYIPDNIERDVLNMDDHCADQNENGVLDGNESNGSSSWADQFFYMQWHIQSLGNHTNDSGVATIPGNDLHLMEVYHQYMGYNNGTPIIVQVVDTGVDADHEDLEDNMDLDRSYDGENVGDPSPNDTNEGYTHGTMVAGIMAARAFNGLGVRGIAPFAKLAGSNWLESQTYSALEKVWLTGQGADEIAVTNNSWGSYFDTDTVLEEIMADGVKNLRDGKGRIYVFAAGNDRGNTYGNGNANLQYMLSNRYAIAVAALKNDNTYADYSNPGANLLVSGYSGNFYQDSPTIGTTTVMGTSSNSGDINQKTTWSDDEYENYTYAMNGTSAAAPTVAGVLALVLEACPDLTWRDVRHLIATTATKIDSGNNTWITNGAGLHFSTDYGFGLINAKGMIDQCSASGYTLLPAEENTTVSISPDTPIPDKDSRTFTLNVSENLTTEWVEVTIDNNSTYASDYRVELESPAGTKVQLMQEGNGASQVVENWMEGGFRMSTAAMMDENSSGEWKVKLSDKEDEDEGTVKSIKIQIFGH
ncbi:S8 family serine peptidase [Nitratifractor sp.]|uniref:S8 family peptidase n=1 Tax=Nitratifractor sp. TaxID=2268144 RepID=UPI0025FC9A84|nr:S8 family serine peptidase [Nitratifractor sp.]